MDSDTPIEKITRLKEEQKKALKRLGLATARDLLFYFPTRYNHIAEIKKIRSLKEGEIATIYGEVISTKTTKAYRKKIPIAEVVVEDDTGKMRATWFHQVYVAKMLKKGNVIKLSGKVTKGKNGLYLANPEFEKADHLPIDTSDSLFKKEEVLNFSYAIYPETRGLTSRWFYHTIQRILKAGVHENIDDSIPEKILEKYNLPSLSTALVWIHSPKKPAHSESARKRFAFEEIFFIQLTRLAKRKEYESHPSFTIDIPKEKMKSFMKRFSFEPTKAQHNAVESILKDFKTPKPMARLLEGDVGSGKTFVAAATAYATVQTRPNNQNFGNLQVAYMAPTEILAGQHFQSFVDFFSHLPINIGLITGSGCKKFPSKVNPAEATDISRAQLLKWVKNGEIAILVGTHSLIQKTVEFENLAYVIIDEQHRFGTRQRARLVRKDEYVPHLLSMTATPIPRTLALTIYGDLDLTLLDEMPAGRKAVKTEIVLPPDRDKAYDTVREELEAGRQAYVICPRINEPDETKAQALRVKSVKEEAKRLKKEVFPEYRIDILHSKLKTSDKEDVMERFLEHEIDILVSTSVVEVGVNVENATAIIIEGAERFGLAQLHQLRGRVLRSTHQPYCFVFADTKADTSLKRLKALRDAKNGFELSEYDLELRGAGELAGGKQWGISDIGMEAIKNIKMVEAAREEAKNILEKDKHLNEYPNLKEKLTEQKEEVHFE